jgi:hypothetical protein
VIRVAPGNAAKFSDVPSSDLLGTLVGSRSRRGFGQGDDAEAFAQTPEGKLRILDALSKIAADSPLYAPSIDLLLSFAGEKSEDSGAVREIAEQVIKLALDLSPIAFDKNADRFCYWIDATDQQLARLSDVEALWLRLLPLAEQRANDKTRTDHYSEGSDLTMAALNEPLGHLISFVLRRCQPIRDRKNPIVPNDLLARLNQLHGRAKELWANRMAVSMNYFFLVDQISLKEIVIDQMLQPSEESDRLWEAFARYGQVPSSVLWDDLQAAILPRLYSLQLTPDSKRRLAEMCVITWVWSCRGHSYTIKASHLRSALSLTNDDVRAAAAWQFSSIFRQRDDASPDKPSAIELWEKLGRRFFAEVWPLEPALQSPSSANDFAKIPASVAPTRFADAVSVVAPFIVPFKVWSLRTEFDLNLADERTQAIIQLFSEDLLTLLSLSISDTQGHGVFDLREVLTQITVSHPVYESDFRTQRLRKIALEIR